MGGSNGERGCDTLIIAGKNLRLYYWVKAKYCYDNFPEIAKGQYGYILQPGQKVAALRYENTNQECYFECTIIEVSEEGVLIKDYRNEYPVFVPWVKWFPIPAPNGPIVKCHLYVEPCDSLAERYSLKEILTGFDGTGRRIWHRHSGVCYSGYEGNLRNFIRLGQLEIT